ncbi:asparagine synthase (glutamine-hydrolyzing) [Fodinicola feengrottensis]
MTAELGSWIYMCGLAGYIGVDSSHGMALLGRMSRAQVHRGPDGDGTFVQAGLGLTHRRLAVIDRAGGAQPMRSQDGRYVLAYNGEVYNYRELRGELVAAGHTFSSASDTEVVLAAWIEWGEAAFDRFDGMFALAIADTVTGQMTLVRDQFGIKPLYLAEDGAGRVFFSSEIRPILATGLIQARPDDTTVYRYLQFRVHDDTQRTFFAGISRLMPGELAVISPAGRVSRRTYTSLYADLRSLARTPRPYDDAARQRFADALRSSIRSRLVSDVPVGTALSGGLDSSTVAATVSELLAGQDSETSAIGHQQQTFSAVFPGETNDEERYVDAVAASLPSVRVHKIEPSVRDFLVDLPDFVRSQEEPVISTGPYAQYCVMKEASQHVTVMLDGQGADEMMAGYIPYYLVHARQLRRAGRTAATAAELASVSGLLWGLGRTKVADKVLMRTGRTVTDLLSHDFVGRHADERMDIVTDDLKVRLEDDLFRHSLPALLRYEDRNTMRFSLEGRVPFLTTELLRTLWSLDDTAIVHAGRNKRALREATAGLLPSVVNRRRKKIGFTTPEDAWFRKMTGPVLEVFSSASFGSRPYFDQAATQQAFRQFIRGRSTVDTMAFWRLFNLELWMREFIDPVQVDVPIRPALLAAS